MAARPSDILKKLPKYSFEAKQPFSWSLSKLSISAKKSFSSGERSSFSQICLGIQTPLNALSFCSFIFTNKKTDFFRRVQVGNLEETYTDGVLPSIAPEKIGYVLVCTLTGFHPGGPFGQCKDKAMLPINQEGTFVFSLPLPTYNFAPSNRNRIFSTQNPMPAVSF